MVGLGFSGALHGFERRVWSVTLYFILFRVLHVCFISCLCVCFYFVFWLVILF